MIEKFASEKISKQGVTEVISKTTEIGFEFIALSTCNKSYGNKTKRTGRNKI